MIAYATGEAATTGSNYGSIIQIVVLIALFALMMFFMTRSQKNAKRK